MNIGYRLKKEFVFLPLKVYYITITGKLRTFEENPDICLVMNGHSSGLLKWTAAAR